MQSSIDEPGSLMSWVCNYKYLSEEKLKGFDNYKYSSIDNSPISVYISHPFWNQVVKLYPKWLAPNLLTLTGFLMVMSGYMLVSFFDYELFAASQDKPEFLPVPNWIWLYCAICTFVAHVLDGTDGKQARRTGTSGPTGELFDHGLDSWATLPFTVTLFSAFGRTEFSLPAIRLLCVLISVQLVFICTHWEKYNTGVLFLSWGYDLSQYGLSLFYLMTYFVGYKWWQFYIGPGFTMAELLEAGFYCLFGLCFMFYTCPKPFNLPRLHYSSYYVDKTGLQPNIAEGMRPLFPFVALCIISIGWGLYSPTDVINNDPRAFIWLNGTLFSNIASRLIVSQMTKTRAEGWNSLLFIQLTGAVLAQLHVGPLMELWTMRSIAVIVTLAHIHYGVNVVNQLCDHFNRYAFRIGTKLPDKAAPTKTDYSNGTESVSLLAGDDDQDDTIIDATQQHRDTRTQSQLSVTTQAAAMTNTV